jgi:hypothetical protein
MSGRCPNPKRRNNDWRKKQAPPNPTGKGGFQFRKHDLMVVGGPNSLKCGAVTRRSGLPCRNLPVGLKPGGRCDKHGGKTTRAGVLARNERQHYSKAVATVKKASRALVEKIELHPAAHEIFKRHEAECYPPSAEILLLACDQLARAEISRSDFEKVLDIARQHTGPRNPNPKRWRRKAPFVATPTSTAKSKSKSNTATTATTASKPTESQLDEIEAQLVDRRYAARPSSVATEPKPERWSIDRNKKPSGF